MLIGTEANQKHSLARKIVAMLLVNVRHARRNLEWVKEHEPDLPLGVILQYAGRLVQAEKDAYAARAMLIL